MTEEEISNRALFARRSLDGLLLSLVRVADDLVPVYERDGVWRRFGGEHSWAANLKDMCGLFSLFGFEIVHKDYMYLNDENLREVA